MIMKVYKMFMTVCMVVGLSMLSVNAKVAQTTQVADSKVGISKEDAQMLFGTEKANVEVLTQKEMEALLGIFLTGLFVGLGGWLLNGLIDGDWEEAYFEWQNIPF